jgi:hypothetical protein
LRLSKHVIALHTAIIIAPAVLSVLAVAAAMKNAVVGHQTAGITGIARVATAQLGSMGMQQG